MCYRLPRHDLPVRWILSSGSVDRAYQLSGWNYEKIKASKSICSLSGHLVPMDHLNTFSNCHIAHIFDWSIAPEQHLHPSLPVANWDGRKASAIPFFPETTMGLWRPDGVSANVTSGQLLYLTMWADPATISTVLLPLRRRNWENSTWTDFIPHSGHSKCFWQRHMVQRSAQQHAAQPQAWAVFTWLYQATCAFRQAMYAMSACSHAGRHTSDGSLQNHRWLPYCILPLLPPKRPSV